MHHLYISNNINIQDNKSSMFFKMNIFLSSVEGLLKLTKAVSGAGRKELFWITLYMYYSYNSKPTGLDVS